MFCRGNCTGSILITYYDIIVIIIDIYTKYVLYARHAHTHTCNGLAYVAAQIDTLADQSGEKFGAGEGGGGRKSWDCELLEIGN